MLILTLAACGGDNGVEGDTSTVLRVEVSPGDVVMQPGETRSLSASVYGAGDQPLSGNPVSWQSSDAAVASVNGSGVVTAVAEGSATVSAASGGKSGSANVTVLPQGVTGQVIQVLPGATYQTIKGWEGTAQIGELECNPTAFANYRATLVNRLVNELGINRVRLPIISGSENPTDWFAQLRQGQISQSTWRTHRYEIVNDNSNPSSANSSGFQFSLLDYTIDNVVQPLRQALAARGEQLYVNLNYVDFGSTPFEHTANPAEYGELMLQAFQHMQSKYGWVPDAIEVILEPDNTGNWRPATIGAAIVAAGDRLKSAGFHPAFIAPSNTNMTAALQYFDALLGVPRIQEYLTDFAYHRYGGVTDATLLAIGNRAQQHGVRTQMLEHIGSGYQDLHADLTTGRNSSWQQFALAYCNPTDDGSMYYQIVQSNPSAPQVILTNRARYLRQYFLRVRQGAVRVGALSGDNRFSPVAFRNTNGKHVLVVKASAAGNFDVRGLPAGTYGVFYTTAAAFNVQPPDLMATAGQAVQASIPAAGVITLYQR